MHAVREGRKEALLEKDEVEGKASPYTSGREETGQRVNPGPEESDFWPGIGKATRNYVAEKGGGDFFAGSRREKKLKKETKNQRGGGR